MGSAARSDGSGNISVGMFVVVCVVRHVFTVINGFMNSSKKSLNMEHCIIIHTGTCYGALYSSNEILLILFFYFLESIHVRRNTAMFLSIFNIFGISYSSILFFEKNQYQSQTTYRNFQYSKFTNEKSNNCYILFHAHFLPLEILLPFFDQYSIDWFNAQSKVFVLLSVFGIGC